MRKNDQILMWEAYIGESSEAVSMGGPLKAGGGKSPSKSSDYNSGDAESRCMEDEEDELHGILKKFHSGDITSQEAHKHITTMMKGDKEEDAENVKRKPRPSPEESKRSMGVRGPGGKDHNVKKNTPKLDAMGRPLKTATVRGV